MAEQLTIYEKRGGGTGCRFGEKAGRWTAGEEFDDAATTRFANLQTWMNFSLVLEGTGTNCVGVTVDRTMDLT